MSTHGRGFTLIELLVTLTLAAFLLGIGIPALRHWIAHYQLTQAHGDLVATLMLARSEAIKRSRPVLARNTDGTWHSGWIVFADTNRNGIRDADEPVLHRSAVKNGVRATGNTPVRQFVRYVPSGQTKTLGGAFQAGTITLCDESKQRVRLLVISATGRVRTALGTAGVC
jgi:type IV fimbrial biogenesis protein FimT